MVQIRQQECRTQVLPGDMKEFHRLISSRESLLFVDVVNEESCFFSITRSETHRNRHKETSEENQSKMDEMNDLVSLLVPQVLIWICCTVSMACRHQHKYATESIAAVFVRRTLICPRQYSQAMRWMSGIEGLNESGNTDGMSCCFENVTTILPYNSGFWILVLTKSWLYPESTALPYNFLIITAGFETCLFFRSNYLVKRCRHKSCRPSHVPLWRSQNISEAVWSSTMSCCNLSCRVEPRKRLMIAAGKEKLVQCCFVVAKASSSILPRLLNWTCVVLPSSWSQVEIFWVIKRAVCLLLSGVHPGGCSILVP